MRIKRLLTGIWVGDFLCPQAISPDWACAVEGVSFFFCFIQMIVISVVAQSVAPRIIFFAHVLKCVC